MPNFEQVDFVHLFILLSVAFQIPFFMEEIREILELHYHGFSSLIMFGLANSFMRKRRRRMNAKGTRRSFLEAPLESLASLANIEDFYNQERQMQAATEEEESDEWGHFAFLDEPTPEDLDCLPPFAQTSSISTLERIVEEED